MKFETVVALTEVGELQGYKASGVFRGIEFAIDSNVSRLADWGWLLGGPRSAYSIRVCCRNLDGHRALFSGPAAVARGTQYD